MKLKPPMMPKMAKLSPAAATRIRKKANTIIGVAGKPLPKPPANSAAGTAY